MDDYTYFEKCQNDFIKAQKRMDEVSWGEHVEARSHRDECLHKFNAICEKLFSPPSL